MGRNEGICQKLERSIPQSVAMATIKMHWIYDSLQRRSFLGFHSIFQNV